ncbi:4'-phosphopantetheinyl transferase family protein [Geodermatophilus marinus]|uniref:4'-phosphopantetheinyl transferase family protein n=1 Tax=Geodermatophilus sp. LHW52908 TaxID=2303986 RepID=UPI001314E304|nr:4'-phosphopantetheinyl transferase superfamily protein [Geodermatophilus sp. LHW52908]
MVVVHLLDLADPGWDLDAAAAVLTAAERERAERGVPAVRRRRLLVRAGLRRVLGGVLGVPPAAVPLRGDRGRPLVDGADLGLSCSAGGDLALVAVAAGARIGVDVQPHRDAEAAAAPAEGWLAPAEQARIAELPAASRLPAVTRCWVQKEAVLKARGTGIRRPPADVVTPVADSGRVGPEWVTALPVPAGSLAALAADVPVPAPGVVLLPPGGPR